MKKGSPPRFAAAVLDLVGRALRLRGCYISKELVRRALRLLHPSCSRPRFAAARLKGLVRRASRLLRPPCSRPRFAAATSEALHVVRRASRLLHPRNGRPHFTALSETRARDVQMERIVRRTATITSQKETKLYFSIPNCTRFFGPSA